MTGDTIAFILILGVPVLIILAKAYLPRFKWEKKQPLTRDLLQNPPTPQETDAALIHLHTARSHLDDFPKKGYACLAPASERIAKARELDPDVVLHTPKHKRTFTADQLAAEALYLEALNHMTRFANSTYGYRHVLKCLDQALKYDPFNNVIHLLHAKYLVHIRRRKDALKAAEKAAELGINLEAVKFLDHLKAHKGMGRHRWIAAFYPSSS